MVTSSVVDKGFSKINSFVSNCQVIVDSFSLLFSWWPAGEAVTLFVLLGMLK